MYKKALIGTVLVAALSMSANLSGAAVKLPAAKQQVKITMSLRGMKLEIPNCVALGLPDCAVPDDDDRSASSRRRGMAASLLPTCFTRARSDQSGSYPAVVK